jgi:tetratricopeptide (TPR) repeat protein
LARKRDVALNGKQIVIAGAVLLSALLPSHAAVASVRSQALYARGLIPFDRGQWEAAYRFFDRAVGADPTDAVALYYRGLSGARLGQRAAAIKDLEHALQLDPKLTHAILDLGIAYFDDGQYPVAKTWLERAYQQGVERFTAAFFLGLTCYRTGDDAGAQKYLNEAKIDPDLRASADYYAGLALLRQGKTDAARAELQHVVQEQPQSEIGKAAQQAIGAGQPLAGGPARRQKPWSVYGEVGFQYDSNAVLAPSDAGVKVSQGITRQSDGRSVIALGGDYQLLDTNFGSARAEYDFYQSIHFHLTEFDLQGHRVRLDLTSVPGTLSYGISGIYDFYALDYQSFFQEGLGTPWVAVNESNAASTQAYYTVRGRDFFRQPYDPPRDSLNNAVGIRQYFDLGTLGPTNWLLNFGYQFDAEETLTHGHDGQPIVCTPTTQTSGCGGRDFQYKGNQADVDLSFPIYSFVQVELAYLFRLEDYQFVNSRSDFQFRRHDNEHQVAIAVQRNLTANISAEIDYFGVINNSNIANFQYDRDIFAASVRVTF